MTDFAEDTQLDATAMRSVPASFFGRSPELVAPDLLGCVVATRVDGALTAGVIVETEAYLGRDDAGSHASTKGITARNAVMYGAPGTAYVYFTYGNHYMLNLVCEPQGVAGAVLVRALRPITGLAEMTARRHGRPLRELCNGPGKLAAAMGIDLSDNGSVLGQGRVSVYYGERPSPAEVAVSGRIGLSAGHELDLRFYMANDPFVSRGRTGPVRPKRR
ncbi:MAG: DNA-3-methyladenine glycosylase [Coriobacteriia bacterium]|nr:DNA-3-methyladenine glycosylase [Coriobacteriia bacterium]